MRLLIVGTLNGQLTTASKMAMDRGAQVTHAPDIETALALLRSRGADMLMVDVGMNIPSLMPKLSAEHFSLPVVACGIGTDPQQAADAIRGGAKEYVPLPPDADLIAAVLAAVAEDEKDFIFSDPVMQNVAALAEQVAPSEASILITGESGTGKEVMARYVHAKSRRSTKPFVAVNCAAIPENLLESELFGHEKGAFTGAVARRVGKFEEADGGTLLLDEISEMDVRLQAKLLRAIQERQIDRVGGTKPVNVDIRIVATSNRNLQDSVKAGEFREDLFFRLNVVNLRIPSLRERKNDIRVLSQHFAAKYADLNGVPERPISDEALVALTNHDWPGNVRELENAMHRAVLLASGDSIGAAAVMLPDASGNLAVTSSGASQLGAGQPQQAAPAPQPAAPTNPYAAAAGTPAPAAPAATQPTDQATEDANTAALVGRTVAEVERDLIIDTLKHCLGNRTHAANILGISIRTLRNKLNQYQTEGLSVPQPGDGSQRIPV